MPAGKEIQKWADKAMFEAEPIKESEGPKVYLLSMNTDPLGDIAAADMMFAGRVIRSLSEITDAERIYHFNELVKTRLKAPFEFVNFHFMIEGVTRAFTHQLVRQRTATYVQESMRFAVKTDMPTALPPSLVGVEHAVHAYRNTMTRGPVQIRSDEDEFDRLTDIEKQRILWDESVEFIADHYMKLIDMGMPAEDARGLAPTNVLTRIHYITDLHALLDHAGNRLCTQAQFEWRLVFAQIAKAIREAAYVAPSDDGDDWIYHPVTMREELSKHFAPVCYATGKCEFMANVDRACSIRSRVEASHDIGRTSEHWAEEYDIVPNEVVTNFNPHLHTGRDDDGKPIFIGAIDPREWLLDPTAARVR